MTSIFDKPTLGDILREYRKRHSLTQNDLAERLGVTPNTVTSWETGLSRPGIKNMNRIANELRMSLHEIYMIVKGSKQN